MSFTRENAYDERPRTKRRRLAPSSICFPNSFSFPAPKMIWSAVANSREYIVLPACVSREDVGVFDTVSRLSQHLCGGVAPARIMCGLFVRGRSIRCFIDFNKDELGWVICLLDYIKACNARFLHTIAGILNGCLLEGLYKFRFDIHMNMDDLHFLLL